MIRSYFFVLVACGLFLSCRNEDSEKAERQNGKEAAMKVDTVPEPEDVPSPVKTPEISYSFIHKKDWQSQKDSFEGAGHLDILTAINRTDSGHIRRLDSILVPDRYDLPVDAYMPFPQQVAALKEVRKIIIFSNPAQAFAAYEYGKLVRQGQSNMGKKASPTPPRLYFCNWKARRTTSTVNSSWILNWNFNVSNFGGIGFHQYALPGYPASHSCMRLQDADAYFLYNWAEQWVMKNDKELAKGTPVLVHGTYPFGASRPWYALVGDPKALTLNEESMKAMLEEHLSTILEKQKERAAVEASDEQPATQDRTP